MDTTVKMNEVVIGIYGKSDTGKTTLIEDIIRKLTNEGFKIASVKITNKKIGIDTKGKDTWRHAQAGSKLVVLSSPKETDFILKKSANISEIIRIINQIDKYDLIIVEGANDKYIPKIRLGNIDKRENTIFTYSGDFKEVIEFLKKKIIGGKYDNKS
ncbi:MAG: molybdopterin-guanine dinucleotide biosynthesis protein B [Thermoplasmatales archaeon]|nr:MAG: molybdopterin-guanine dinucleotide biosynthesis protein B [Thermoplasmatales archaeon]